MFKMNTLACGVDESNGQSVTNCLRVQIASCVEVNTKSVDNIARVIFDLISGFDLCRFWASSNISFIFSSLIGDNNFWKQLLSTSQDKPKTSKSGNWSSGKFQRKKKFIPCLEVSSLFLHGCRTFAIARCAISRGKLKISFSSKAFANGIIFSKLSLFSISGKKFIISSSSEKVFLFTVTLKKAEL